MTIRLGQMALERGLITPEQLRDALSEQARDATAGRKKVRQLGNILVAKGYLKPEQLVPLLDEQQAESAPAAKPKEPSAHGALGKYSLLRELGRGGMGVVHEALDTQLDRRVALKTLLASRNADPKETALEEERFLREARLSASLPKHPHIVSVYEAGVIDGKQYLAMEYIDGQALSTWRKAGSVTIRQQVKLLRDVALAVNHAHRHGVIHRDLKPENILIDSRNEPHITDFGLAKTVGQNVSLSLTASGMIMGTPSYMSPEQAQGPKGTDHRTDIYALGVMLYETLTGRLPFTGETAIEILMKASRSPVTPPSSVVRPGHPTLDKTIENICLKALAKNPRDRYQTAEAFAGDLTGWLKGEEVRVVPPTARRMYQPPKKRLPRALAAAGAVVAIALLAILLRPAPSSDSMESGLSPAIAKNYESHLSHGRYEDALVLANALNDKSKRENVRLRMISGADDLFESKKYAEAIGLYDRVLDKFKGDVAALKGKEAARRKLDELEKGRWISLLAFVDPSKDTISGSWTWKDGKLVSDESAFARIEIPYRPPEEFDVRMEFVRQTGRAGVALALSRGGRAFDWVMGASSNAAAGFETISGAIVKENPTRSPGAVENGRAYTVLVEVRKDGLKSFINGQPSAAWKTDYSDLGVYSGWKLRDNGLLGLGSHESSTAFSRLELREVSGKGTAVSRAAAGAPDEWAASIARLPAPEQARRVVAELRKLNPVLEEKEVTFKEKDGVIVELSIESSAIRDLSPVRALKGLELLRSNGAKDPATKKAVAAPLSDLSTLKGLRLKELSVSDTMVQDLSPLEGMPLWALYIFSTPVRDLAPLRGMPLEELYCAQSPISDLSPLSKLPLRILFMNSTAVRTLEPLRGLSLIKLGASWMEISDLSPLANMRLEYLDVEHTPVADLSPVKGMPLQRLWCAGTKVTDLSVIAGMPLKDLECEFVPERDLALLRSITSLERINDMAAAEFWKKFGAPGTELPPEEQVRQVVRKMKELNPEFDGKETHKIEDGQVVHLSISAMGVTNVSPVRALSRLENFQCTGFWNQAKGEIKISDFADLSPLRGLPLRSVNVQRTRVRDLSPLAAMPLAALNCMDTQVGDLTPLAAVPLTHLECYNAPVSDLSPLKGKNMEWLNIDSTQVSDLSPISGMQLAGVLLYNTKVTDLSPLKTIPHLKFLECTYNPMRDREILRSIKTLEKINDMPVAEFWKKQDQK